MFEKVNPSHPDKIADRIAGAIVDLAYGKQDNPRIAVEVLIGHGECHIIAETSVHLPEHEIEHIVARIAEEKVIVDYKEYAQDAHLADNQKDEIRCGDNGIFKGVPVTDEQQELADIAQSLYDKFPTDGKFVYNRENDQELIVCQSKASNEELEEAFGNLKRNTYFNPLGAWTGGVNVDTGATNRKLGSDMGDGVTGGGLHGKDLSKADVCVNIYCHQVAQIAQKPITAYCAIGDNMVDVNGAMVPYSAIVASAREYIKRVGGFEKFAEWGLIRRVSLP